MHSSRFGALILAGVFAVLGLVSSPAQQASPGDPGCPSLNPPVFEPQPASPAVIWKAPVASAAPTVEWTYHKTADGTHPNGEEQRMVWLMNRARANPTQEGIWLATSTLPDIAVGRSQYGVNTTILRNEFASYPVKPPAAFDLRLYNAAKAHSDWLIASRTTNSAHVHDGQFDRVTSAGFHYRGAEGRGSVFLWANNGLHAHAAFNIDWGGNDGTGMQTGRGHRMGIMSPNQLLVNVGISMVPATSPQGPLVTTIDYCEADTAFASHYNIFIVGTVWQDANLNGLYDVGEGLPNITARPDQGTYFAITGAGGGYAIPITQAGTYAVTFSGFAGGGSVTKSVSVNGSSVPLDCGLPQVQSAYPSGTPWSVPGTIQAENFDNGGEGVAFHDTTANNTGGSSYRSPTAVDMEDAGSGHVLDWVLSGEWLEYTVNIGSSGSYALQACMANSEAGGTFRMEMDGVNKTGSMAVPATGGWTTYRTNQSPTFALSSGIHTMRVYMVLNAANGSVGNFDWFRLMAALTPVQSAYPSGTPWSVPGTIQAENFDNGGEGLAFHDTTANNTGGSSYRSPTAVDMEDAGSGRVLDWVLAGEWLEYTVNIGSSGSYVLQACAANTVAGGTFRMEMDGGNKTGTMSVPGTGSWTTYQTNQSPAFSLSSGIHTMRLYMVASAANGSVGNFDWFKLSTAVTPVQSAYPSGTPWPVPGRIEVENYDRGGEGIAYHDSDAQNLGGAYRPSEGVDIGTLPNTVTCLAWAYPGEWLEYTINSAGGSYRAVLSFASLGPGGQFRILLDGANLFGKTFTIPNTGGWDAFIWMRASAVVPIPAGQHVLRLEMVSAGPSGGVGNLNYLQFETAAPLTPGKQAGSTEAPRPVLILTSTRGTGGTNGWLAVDGDAKTGWKGAEDASGWWMAFAYDQPILVKGVDIRFGENSPTNVLYLGSPDLLQWFDLREAWSIRAAELEYLWMIFPDDGTGRPPDVREVLVK